MKNFNQYLKTINVRRMIKQYMLLTAFFFFNTRQLFIFHIKAVSNLMGALKTMVNNSF